MIEDIKGFLMLVILFSTVPLVAVTIPEALNLITNYKNYSGALMVLVVGFIALIFGSIAYGVLKNEIK